MAKVREIAGDSRRDELLSAAWVVAARDGLSSCTYRGVAAEAGTSPTPLIRQFPAREALLAALLEEVFERQDTTRGEAVVEGDPIETLVAEGAAALSGREPVRESNRIALDLSFHALRDPKMRRRLAARDAQLTGRWRALIEEAGDRGTAREDRPAAEIADQLTSLLSGLAFASLVYPRRLPAHHVTRLWEDGARRLVDPAVTPGVHQRLVIPEPPAVASLAPASGTSRSEELLAIAFRVTARDGLSGLSFRRLADEAGTSTTPFTYAFGSRKRLLEAMVRATWEGDAEVKALASRIANPIDRFFAEWAAELSDEPLQVDRERVYFELHHEGLTSPVLAAQMREVDQYGFATSLPFIEAGREEGLVRDDIAESDLVDCLYALNDGIGLRRVLLAEKRPAGYRIALWEDGGRRMLAP